jgi:two-component system phosphate regulon sensor histidine kinase PhoR
MDEQNDTQSTVSALERRTQELQTLVQVAQLINVIDLDFVLAQTLKLTTEVSGASKGSFFLLDDNGMPIQRFITQRNLPPEMTRQVATHVIKQGLAGWSIRNRRGAIVEDVEADERWFTFDDDEQADVRSALCMPVLHEEKIQGVMTLVNPEVGHFDEHHLQLVSAVANQSSTAIRNAQLFDNVQSQQRQLELIYQNNNEAIITMGTDFTIKLINPMAVSLLTTVPDGDLIGQNLAELDPQSIFPEIVTRVSNIPRDTIPLSFELRDEGQGRDFIVSVSSLVNARTNMMSGFVVLIHDVTTIKDFDRLKTHMLHMLSHDIKNPINIIWGYIDLMRIDAQDENPADPRFVDGILRALHRIENLIEELLNVERFISAGQPQPQQVFSPLAILKEAIEGLSQFTKEKRHTVIEDIGEDLGMINGMAFEVREAMANLISNAIKYTPEGGQIQIHASKDEKHFKFHVKDSGVGIPKDLQNKLFEEFYRAHRPSMKGIEGTGLGLSLVKSSIKRHFGDVWFESEENVGSTFGFWIPLASNQPPEGDPPPSA